MRIRLPPDLLLGAQIGIEILPYKALVEVIPEA